MDLPIIQYIGKFHPLLVHLPIGMLLIAVLFTFLSSRENYAYLKGASHIVLLISALSATFSCFTGWLLSRSGGYDNGLLGWHQWMAVSLTLFSWLAFFVHHRHAMFTTLLMSFIGLLLIVTGHLGGSITHGVDFLTPPPVSNWLGEEPPAIVLTPENKAFDAVGHILDKNCKSCHGPGKSKGELRLDSEEGIRKGGENGEILGSTGEQSELLERLFLPVDDDDHMPPKEKRQLSETEFELLVTWVESGSPFDKTILELGWPDSLIANFNKMTSGVDQPVLYDYTPTEPVAAASPAILQRIDSLGGVVSPVSNSSNYVSVNLRLVAEGNLLAALETLSDFPEQVIWLDMTGQELRKEHMNTIARLVRLRKLTLARCSVDNSQVESLRELKDLEYLNLVGNFFSIEGLETLKSLRNIKKLFLFETRVSKNDSERVKALFPKAEIDLGGYEVPIVATDTIDIVF